MSLGWYDAPQNELLQRFYDYISEHYDGMDDFILAIEEGEKAPFCFSDWDYTEEKEDNFLKFDIPSKYTKDIENDD